MKKYAIVVIVFLIECNCSAQIYKNTDSIYSRSISVFVENCRFYKKSDTLYFKETETISLKELPSTIHQVKIINSNTIKIKKRLLH